MYPEKKHATGYVVNFTTKKEQCDYFPERTNASLSLLNVHVYLDDPDKNFYYVYEPRELEQGMASLSLGHSKPAAKQARSTPLKAKLGGRGTRKCRRCFFFFCAQWYVTDRTFSAVPRKLDMGGGADSGMYLYVILCSHSCG